MIRSGQCRYRYGDAKSDGDRMGGTKESTEDRPKDGTEGGDLAVALQSGTPKQQLQYKWWSAHESWRWCTIYNAATSGVILVQLLQAWLQHK